MSTSNKAKRRRYQAVIDDRTIDLEVSADHVRLDEREQPFSAEWLSEHSVSLIIGSRSVEASIRRLDENRYIVQLRGHEFEVQLKDERDLLLERFGMASVAQEGVQEIRAPMPGLVLSVAVAEGADVHAGGSLLVLEAMKMENEIRSDRPGKIRAVHVSPGDAVGKNDLLLEIED